MGKHYHSRRGDTAPVYPATPEKTLNQVIMRSVAVASVKTVDFQPRRGDAEIQPADHRRRKPQKFGGPGFFEGRQGKT